MRKEAKSKIYKATVRPIMAYGLETRTDIRKPRQMSEANEMKTIRKIVGRRKMAVCCSMQDGKKMRMGRTCKNNR